MANYFPFYQHAESFFGPKEPVLLTPLFNEPFGLDKFSTYLFEFFYKLFNGSGLLLSHP